ncbi:response regulator [Marinospirillum alkaliphilum]|uniref:Response regulator receiver domain-containing protein n=1 Tax=Marinospirillum alkaliphilum DSM 21637 TaxID=1122209 RepID=A0A1K1WVV0_9GAMM|nr:response regulator [Marinospirillum alkaliphilum]SFX40909.1 Response regulator receiver domain-containing protein [Marinospirillum alkaliphilum DSM 21637]
MVTGKENREPFNLLLVEDEPADAYLVRVALEESGLNAALHHVENANQALSYLRHEPPWQQSIKPSLILLDLNMPGMHGRDLLVRLKSDVLLKSIPVVVLTTSDAETDIKSCYEAGAAGFITKPMDIDQFIRVIRGLGDYWVNLLRTPSD